MTNLGLLGEDRILRLLKVKCVALWAFSLSPSDLPLSSVGGLMGGDLTSGAGTSAGEWRLQY